MKWYKSFSFTHYMQQFGIHIIYINSPIFILTLIRKILQKYHKNVENFVKIINESLYKNFNCYFPSICTGSSNQKCVCSQNDRLIKITVKICVGLRVHLCSEIFRTKLYYNYITTLYSIVTINRVIVCSHQFVTFHGKI